MFDADTSVIHSKPAKASETQGWWVILACLFVFAVLFRLEWFGDYGFPINDGALFVVIAEAIIANGMVPPVEYSFNGEVLPLGYPPLALWIVAAIARITGFDTITIATWYPLATNIVLMIGFVGLLRAMRMPWMVLIVAAGFFFFQDRSFKFLIMGGGITRGTGAAFTILALWATVRMLEAPRAANVAGVAALCGLAILSHLEFGITAASGITILVLFAQRPIIQRLTLLCLVGAGSFLVILPWLAWVFSAHGTSAFLAASETSGWCAICSLQQALRIGFMPWYLAIPGFLGALELARQKKHFWLVYALAILFLTPRHAPSALVIPTSVLAAYGFLHLVRLFSEGAKAWNDETDGSQLSLLSTPLTTATLAAIMVGAWTSLGATISNIQLTGMETLSSEARAGMGWVDENVPPGSRFIVFSGEPWATDEAAEWFPYLTSSFSVSTAQGLEWVGNGYFLDMLAKLELLDDEYPCAPLVDIALSTFPTAEYVFAVERINCFDADDRLEALLRRPGVGVYRLAAD